MSQLSSSSAFCECNMKQPNLSTNKLQEPDMSTPMIPTSPTFQQQNQRPNKDWSAKCIADIAFPMVLTGLLLYSRSMISMLFLGRLGELALAGGSLAIGFANITGYSVLSGLAMGMEPICGKDFGAKRFKLLGLAMQRTVILLLLTSVVISLLWLNMKKILLLCGQEEDIATEAHSYILYSLPDLIAQSILHPLRIYLLSQSITLPLTFCDTLSIVLHVPINYLLVSVLGFGIRGIALSAVWTNFNLVGSLIIYIVVSGVHRKSWSGIATTVSHQNGLNHGVTDADNPPSCSLQKPGPTLDTMYNNDFAYDTIYGYLSVLLVALVGVKYQALNTDPFHEHTTIMFLFFISIFTYAFALTELKLRPQNNTRSPILRVICHVSGILANELLLLLILINPLQWFIINVSSILLVQASCYCYQYVSPLFNLQGWRDISIFGWIWNFGRKVEQETANDQIEDLEAAIPR